MDGQQLLLLVTGGEFQDIKKEPFQLPKPNKNRGIGVDQLPLSVQHSNILTGNDLGCLGNADRLPTKQQVEQAKQHVAVREILFYDKRIDKKRELHKTAQFELRKGNQDEALAILCIADQLTYDD